MKKLVGRGATAAVLLALAALLVAPGIAQAHVRVKYRSEYKHKVTSYSTLFTVYAVKYDNTKDQSTNLAAALEPMIGDPDQHSQLVAGEEYATSLYNRGHAAPREWFDSLEVSVDAFKAKAARYFAAVAQRRLFKQRCDALYSAFGDLLAASYYYLYESFSALGTDPPDLILSAEHVARADTEAALAHEHFDEALASLRKLL
jgi:hypothetical protein